MNVVLNRPIQEDDMDVANAVELTVLCRELHCLPRPGGLLDQDSYHIWLMNLVTMAQLERSELERKRLDKK
jgi:hypothetical protein